MKPATRRNFTDPAPFSKQITVTNSSQVIEIKYFYLKKEASPQLLPT